MLLASPEASYISGAILPVTGGEPLQRLTLLSLLSRGNQPALYSLANREHHVGDGVEQHVDLNLEVSSALRPERRLPHISDGESQAILKIVSKAIGEHVDIAHVVSASERPNPREAFTRWACESVQHLLSAPPSIRIPGLFTVLGEKTITLTVREGVFETLECGVDMRWGVPALLHRQGGVTDTRGGHHGGFAPPGTVGSARLLEKILDLLDVIPDFRAPDSWKSCAHPPYSVASTKRCTSAPKHGRGTGKKSGEENVQGVGGRRTWKDRIEAVEKSSVAGQPGADVFDAQVPFDQ